MRKKCYKIIKQADVAQWQSNRFVSDRLSVQVRPSAPKNKYEENILSFLKSRVDNHFFVDWHFDFSKSRSLGRIFTAMGCQPSACPALSSYGWNGDFGYGNRRAFAFKFSNMVRGARWRRSSCHRSDSKRYYGNNGARYRTFG